MRVTDTHMIQKQISSKVSDPDFLCHFKISRTQAPFILLLYCLDHFNVQSACATSGHRIHIPANQKACPLPIRKHHRSCTYHFSLSFQLSEPKCSKSLLDNRGIKMLFAFLYSICLVKHHKLYRYRKGEEMIF